MYSVIVVVIGLCIFSEIDALYENKFEATRGCLQYDSFQGYNFTHPYFSTGAFKNVRRRSDNTTELRIGVVGKNDGHLRLASVQYPYDETVMNEIVLSGWANTRIAVRRYVRTSPEVFKDQVVLRDQSSIGLLSMFEPLMFTIAFHPNGLVQFTKDGDTVPFLEFSDTTLSFKYLSFSNWDVPVIYFFDCPLY